VFILPPSMAELERRLKGRAQDADDIVAGRMARAPIEISHWPEYDYIVVNHDLDHSVAKVRAIVHAERLRRDRQIGLGDFVRDLSGR
ncbi:MAG: guanylate kinase, partial [Alphaproteobacteria bacterium]